MKIDSRKKNKKLLVWLVVVIVLVFFCYVQNNYIVITNYEYSSKKIPKAFDGYNIVQVSDLHNKEFGKDGSRLIKKIEKLSPDMIVLTGDLVDNGHTDIDKALSFVREVVDLAPVYYITGNHDIHLEEYEKNLLFNGLSQYGVTYLSDESVDIQKDGEMFSLIGLEDDSLYSSTLLEMVAKEKLNDFKILLAHEPQYLKKYSQSGVDLVFAGHAHGGQIRLPFIGGMVAPDQGFFPEYSEGVHKEKSTTMVISRGLGNSVILLRVFNYPEIVCVTLKKES